MKKLLLILSVVFFANQANANIWACAGWDDGGTPQPFMIGYRDKGFLLTSENTRDTYKLRDEDLEDFNNGKYMTLLAYEVKERADDGSLVLEKYRAILITQRQKKLELTKIDGMNTTLNKPFDQTERTYCHEVE